MLLKNKYFLLRHGEAISNIKNLISCWPEKFYNPLTQKGKKEAKESAEKLKKEKIDLIFSSDLLRAKQTAEIAGNKVGVKPIFDKRLREIRVGELNGRPISEFVKFFTPPENRFTKRPLGGENNKDIIKRMYNFFKEAENKYQGENILIISHQLPLFLLEAKINKMSPKNILEKYHEKRLKSGGWKELKT